MLVESSSSYVKVHHGSTAGALVVVESFPGEVTLILEFPRARLPSLALTLDANLI